MPHLEKVGSGDDAYSEAQDILALVGLMEQVKAAGGDAAVRDRLAAAGEDPEAQYLVGCADVCRGQLASGIARLVDLSVFGSGVHEAAREAAASSLRAAGREDEDIEGHRRRLSRMLF